MALSDYSVRQGERARLWGKMIHYFTNEEGRQFLKAHGLSAGNKHDPSELMAGRMKRRENDSGQESGGVIE